MAATINGTDLERIIGAAQVDRLADDDGDGLRDAAIVDEICQQAEDLARSYLLKSYGDEQIDKMLASDGTGDRAVRVQMTWIAAELLAERRHEFLNAEGKGNYWLQYERAVKYLERIGKGQGHSVAQPTAGASARQGGTVSPTLPADVPPLTFATSKNNPFGSGGF